MRALLFMCAMAVAQFGGGPSMGKQCWTDFSGGKTCWNPEGLRMVYTSKTFSATLCGVDRWTAYDVSEARDPRAMVEMLIRSNAYWKCED